MVYTDQLGADGRYRDRGEKRSERIQGGFGFKNLNANQRINKWNK